MRGKIDKKLNSERIMKPLFLNPFLKSAVWGGERLIGEYGFDFKAPLAEAWLLSCFDGARCFVGDKSLSDSTAGELSNVIVKLIDAKEKLSLQVHPDDGDGNGKNEAWYIIDCKENSEIILGFSRDTSREEVGNFIKAGEIDKILQKVPVVPGDIVQVDAKTVHSVGDGILLCEVQQRSDTTYRVYDYNRRDSNGNLRELHVEKALDVMNYSKTDVKKRHFDGFITAFPENEYFESSVVNLSVPYIIKNEEKSTFAVIVKGSASLSSDGETYLCGAGTGFIVPKGCRAVITGGATAVVTTAKR